MATTVISPVRTTGAVRTSGAVRPAAGVRVPGPGARPPRAGGAGGVVRQTTGVRTPVQGRPARPAAARPAPARPARPAAVRAAAVRPAPTRLTPRGRRVLLVLALAVVGGWLGLGGAAAEGPAEPVTVSGHTVVAGETLWGIAAGIAQPGQDVRDVVATIQELNELSGSMIIAGDLLLLPVP